jgi:hypothetical protein
MTGAGSIRLMRKRGYRDLVLQIGLIRSVVSRRERLDPWGRKARLDGWPLRIYCEEDATIFVLACVEMDVRTGSSSVVFLGVASC